MRSDQPLINLRQFRDTILIRKFRRGGESRVVGPVGLAPPRLIRAGTSGTYPIGTRSDMSSKCPSLKYANS
jgi:hypothetical protein